MLESNKPTRSPEVPTKEPDQLNAIENNVASSLTTPESAPENEDDIPEIIDAKDAEALKEIKKNIDENFEAGPLAGGMYAIMKYFLMATAYADKFIPQRFRNKLEKNEELGKLKFNNEELEKIKNAEIVDFVEPRKYMDFSGEERRSTIAAAALLGIDVSGLSKAEQLAAKLESSELYGSIGLDFMKRNGVPKGAVLVVSHLPTDDLKSMLENSYHMVFVGIGNNQVKGYDPRKEQMMVYDMNDPNSPLGKSFNLTASYIPKFNKDPEFYAKNVKFIDEKVDESPIGQFGRAVNEMDARAKKVQEAADAGVQEGINVNLQALLTVGENQFEVALSALGNNKEAVKLKKKELEQIHKSLKNLDSGETGEVEPRVRSLVSRIESVVKSI